MKHRCALSTRTNTHTHTQTDKSISVCSCQREANPLDPDRDRCLFHCPDWIEVSHLPQTHHSRNKTDTFLIPPSSNLVWLIIGAQQIHGKHLHNCKIGILVLTAIFTRSTGRMMRWCSSVWPPSRRSIGSSAWQLRDSATACATWSPHLKLRWGKQSAITDSKSVTIWHQ